MYLEAVSWLDCTKEERSDLVFFHPSQMPLLTEFSPTSSPAPTPQPAMQALHPHRSASVPSASRREPSTVLIDTATLAPEAPQPPTLEQNMAFAALQQQQELESETDMDTS